MPAIIPVSNTTTTIELVVLDGTSYTLRTYYNDGASMWFLDILLGDANIAAGLALTPNDNILQYSAPLRMSIGELRILDLNGEGNTKPENLGVDAILLYFTPGEFETLYPTYNQLAFRPLPYDINAMFTNILELWSLKTGAWNDNGQWVDTAVWMDSP